MDFVMYASPLTLPIYARSITLLLPPPAVLLPLLLSFFSNGKSNQTFALSLLLQMLAQKFLHFAPHMDGGFDNDDARISAEFSILDRGG